MPEFVTPPHNMKALVCEGVGQPVQLQEIATPEIIMGAVIVKVLVAIVDANTPRILSGEMGFAFAAPLVPGSRAIGRVAVTSPDSASLQVGQLVLLEPHIKARDDNDVQVLWTMWEGVAPAGKKVMANAWRNGCYAEYVRAPLENCWPLNENVLCKQLGYTIPELIYMTVQLITYGGFRGIGLKPGETVIIAPATGMSSGAATGVAIAMGANVIAVSRNLLELQKIQARYPRVNVVATKGDVDEDTAAIMKYGPADAYLDISPPWASKSTHMRSCFNALKPYGRVSLMGVLDCDVPVPYSAAVMKNLTIRGQYMYERADVRSLIKLVESGLLKLGKDGGQEVVGEYKLEDFQKALDTASANAQAGKITVIIP